MEEITRRNFIKAATTIPAAGGCLYTLSNVGPLQCGVVGLGQQGRKLIESIDPKFTSIQGVFDSKSNQTKSGYEWFPHWLPKEYAHFYPRYEDMLDDRSIEAVIIATPLFTHSGLAIQALKAGKHVFVERMMAATPEECREMVSLADQNHLTLQVGHPQFFSPVFWDAFQVIHAGVLGNVYHCRIVTKSSLKVDSRMGRHIMSLGKELTAWQLHPDQSYGLWSESCCEWLGWVSGLFPNHKPVAVQAHSNVINPPTEMKVDTNLYALIEYGNNLTVSLTSLFNWDKWDEAENEYLQIMGTQGTLLISYIQSKNLYQIEFQYEHIDASAYNVIVDFIEEHPDTSVYYLSGYHGNHHKNPPVQSALLDFMYSMELKSFSYSIRTNNPVYCDGVMGMRIANTCYAAQLVAKTHKRELIVT